MTKLRSGLSRTLLAALLLLTFTTPRAHATPCRTQQSCPTSVATSTSVTSSPSSVIAGSSVVISASVTSSPGLPYGKVMFKLNGTQLMGTSTLSNGKASETFSTRGVAAGTYSVTASYEGEPGYAPSTGQVSVVVTSNAPAALPTTTTLVLSPTSVATAKTFTATAAVGSTSGTPSGTVAFTFNGVTTNATLVGGSATVTLSAPATAGTYAVSAAYPASSTYLASSAAANETVTSSSGGTNPTGTPLTACGDIITSGMYYLANNVSSAGTCFFIDADNITLNLNGMTVTFGTGGGSEGTPGILLADSWYTAPGYSLAKTGSTSKHGGFVMYGGSVISATNAAPQSHAIWVGQSNDVSPAPIVHDCTLVTYSVDGEVIFGTGDKSGWQIYNNTVSYMNKTTTSRYYFYGYALWFGDETSSSSAVADQIYNNKITNAPQGGIYDDHDNASITGNDITWNSFYANDYGVIDYSATGQTISNNTIHPTSGRGVDVEAASTLVSGNIITVTELSQDAEYGGCEGGGADGIRIRDNYDGSDQPSRPSGVVLSDNQVNAVATVCQANSLRMTGLNSADSVTFEGNTFSSTGPGSSSVPDYAVSFDGDNQPVLTFTGNTLSSVYAYVQVDWDGANTGIATPQTLLGSPLYGIDDSNGNLDQADDGPTWAQSISIAASTAGAVHCGTYATGPAVFGTTSTTCH
jgi:hypothetical protein